jgi:hypothetical protein
VEEIRAQLAKSVLEDRPRFSPPKKAPTRERGTFTHVPRKSKYPERTVPVKLPGKAATVASKVETAKSPRLTPRPPKRTSKTPAKEYINYKVVMQQWLDNLRNFDNPEGGGLKVREWNESTEIGAQADIATQTTPGPKSAPKKKKGKQPVKAKCESEGKKALV